MSCRISTHWQRRPARYKSGVGRYFRGGVLVESLYEEVPAKGFGHSEGARVVAVAATSFLKAPRVKREEDSPDMPG